MPKNKKFEDVTLDERVSALEDIVNNLCDLENEHGEELETLDSFTDHLETGIDEHEEELTVMDARLTELEQFMEVVSQKLGLNLQKIFDESFHHPHETL